MKLLGAASLTPRVRPDLRRNQIILMVGGFNFAFSRAEALDLIHRIMRAFDHLLANDMGIDADQARHLIEPEENRPLMASLCLEPGA